MPIIAVILGLLFFFISVLIWYTLDSAFGDEDFATNRAAIKAVAEIIRKNNLEQSELYDLGSARGNFVLKILNVCPGLKVYGIDSSRFRTYFARMRALFHSGHAIFIRQDIFAADVSKADIVFMFLDKALMPALERKLLLELKPGAIAITHTVTNTSYFPNWPPSSVHIVNNNHPKQGKLFVYTQMQNYVKN